MRRRRRLVGGKSPPLKIETPSRVFMRGGREIQRPLVAGGGGGGGMRVGSGNYLSERGNIEINATPLV